jgi:hypothetical protein
VCAEAFKNAVPQYWEKQPDSSLETIWLCLTVESYPEFKEIFEPDLRR